MLVFCRWLPQKKMRSRAQIQMCATAWWNPKSQFEPHSIPPKSGAQKKETDNKKKTHQIHNPTWCAPNSTAHDSDQ